MQCCRIVFEYLKCYTKPQMPQNQTKHIIKPTGNWALLRAKTTKCSGAYRYVENALECPDICTSFSFAKHRQTKPTSALTRCICMRSCFTLISYCHKICVREDICFIKQLISFGITKQYKMIQWHKLVPEVGLNCRFKIQFWRVFSVHSCLKFHTFT